MEINQEPELMYYNSISDTLVHSGRKKAGLAFRWERQIGLIRKVSKYKSAKYKAAEK